MSTSPDPVPPNLVPLCVDLDGTLLKTDTLHELVILLAARAPGRLFALPGWLAAGKAGMKHHIAEHVALDPASLPYRPEVLALIEQARAEGRPVILATAASARVAEPIAAHLGLFDAVMASDGTVNLSARSKADALVERYGERGFDYVGNHRDDLPILARANRGTLVSSRRSLRGAASRQHDAVDFVDDQTGGLRAWVKALRVHQWLKNLLVFVPLATGHDIGDPALLGNAILAFIAFSLCASSVYLLNDLLDLRSDRLHATKRRRPFASGALPVAAGVVVAPLLLLAAAALTLFLPPAFALVLGLYFVLTTAYSFWLKAKVVVDVMLLAGLYTVRMIAGSAATGIAPSFWLLALSMFIFLSLALVKRYSELRQLDSDKALAGRGYLPSDLPVLLALGSSSGMVSVLIMAMYTQAEIVASLYPAREWLWAAPPLLLYWVTRLWMKANRGEVDDDPVVFAARDWQSLLVAALTGAAFLLAATGVRFW